MNTNEQRIADRIESVIAGARLPARVEVRQVGSDYAAVAPGIISDEMGRDILLATGAAQIQVQRDYEINATAVALKGARR